MWQLKAQKVIASAKDEAVRMKAHANEECEKLIADAHANAERVCDGFFEPKFTEIVSRCSLLSNIFHAIVSMMCCILECTGKFLQHGGKY